MKTKKVFLLIILVALSSFLISCGSDAKVVKELPAGFIRLSSGGNYPKNNLSYMFDGKQVLFYNANETCIYQSKLSKSDFIIKYQDEYYVNEEKYIELFKLVTGSKVVKNIPTGFVKLNELVNEGLHYGFGESQISFYANGGNCIYQTELSNSDFIVIYNYEYYVNYNKYLEIPNSANVIQTKPAGFIQLNVELDKLENGLDYMFFETSVTFFDADRVGIYATSINDKSFLVLYEDEYYINEKKFAELVDIADATTEQRNKIYNIREEVQLRGGDNSYPNGYSILINEIETGIDGSVFTIKFSISPYVSEYKRTKIFDHVETDKGTIINEFSFIGEGEVQVKVPQGEKISMIFVKSPDYYKAIRRISVS